MSRIVVIVALLLISGLGNDAAAEEGLKETSKDKAKKVRAYLEAIGINNPKIVEFTSTVGERMEGRNLRLAEQQLESGRLVLHYRATPKIGIKQMELKFQPNYSKNTEFVVSTHGVMYQYKYNF